MTLVISRRQKNRGKEIKRKRNREGERKKGSKSILKEFRRRNFGSKMSIFSLFSFLFLPLPSFFFFHIFLCHIFFFPFEKMSHSVGKKKKSKRSSEGVILLSSWLWIKMEKEEGEEREKREKRQKNERIFLSLPKSSVS